ncbi:TonB-dependent iron siderophore receptor protein [Neisseria meningitidis]|nr:TonB-dependent iron siderophore receptor protein [Neisseria meningitidis]
MTAHYKIGKSTRIGLDFENVFNKRYRTMPDIHVYGTPRSLTATVKQAKLKIYFVYISGLTKIGKGDEAADSTDSTVKRGNAVLVFVNPL